MVREVFLMKKSMGDIYMRDRKVVNSIKFFFT